jgi:hypothetical protein
VIKGKLFDRIKGDNVVVVVVEDRLRKWKNKKRYGKIKYSI